MNLSMTLWTFFLHGWPACSMANWIRVMLTPTAVPSPHLSSRSVHAPKKGKLEIQRLAERYYCSELPEGNPGIPFLSLIDITLYNGMTWWPYFTGIICDDFDQWDCCNSKYCHVLSIPGAVRFPSQHVAARQPRLKPNLQGIFKIKRSHSRDSPNSFNTSITTWSQICSESLAFGGRDFALLTSLVRSLD